MNIRTLTRVFKAATLPVTLPFKIFLAADRFVNDKLVGMAEWTFRKIDPGFGYIEDEYNDWPARYRAYFEKERKEQEASSSKPEDPSL